MCGHDIFIIKYHDYVEFRRSTQPPMGKVSKMIKTYTHKQEILDWDRTFTELVSSVKPVTKKVVLSQVYYVGGKVIGYMGMRMFRRICRENRISFPRKNVSKASIELTKLITNSKWRKQYIV